MKLLAIDTATEACSAALLLDGRTLARSEVAGRSHTERLLPMVSGLLAEAGVGVRQLDGIVCGIGPGSFAGVRIGVGYVKGLALASDRPVLGVTSLAMLAMQASAPRVIAAIDARMNEVYVGAFEREAGGAPRLLRAEWVGAPATLAPYPGTWSAVGTGWGAYEDALRAATGAQIDVIDGAALPRAEHALQIAAPRLGEFVNADSLVPLYVRNKVALTLEEQAQKRRAS
jgi:tRNA threonylcarbamoyladenosine biosynthesis protein TsaB